MAQDVVLHEVAPRDARFPTQARMDVVFIHGLGGDHEDTWRGDASHWWPQMVADEYPHIRVWALSYPAKLGELISFGGSDQPGTAVLATVIADEFRNKGVGHQACVLVCHSLGGLIAKRLLLDWNAEKDNPNVLSLAGVKAVLFCGTPHRGSAMANVLKWLSLERVKELTLGAVLDRLGFSASRLPIGIAQTSELITELEKDNRSLQYLNEDFGSFFSARGSADFRVRVYAETEAIRVKGIPTPFVIVDPVSSDPNLSTGGTSKVKVVPVLGKDHSTLVKPKSKGERVVEGLNQLIDDVGGRVAVFGLSSPVANTVAMTLHRELLRCRPMMRLDYFQEFVRSDPPDEADAHRIACFLAQCALEDLRTPLDAIAKGIKGTGFQGELTANVHYGFKRLGCALIAAYLGELLEGQGLLDFDGRSELAIPEMPNANAFNVAVEAAHAMLRHWPSNLILAPDRQSIRSENSLMPAPASVPAEAYSDGSSWHIEDHFQCLVDGVLESSTLGDNEWRMEGELVPMRRATSDAQERADRTLEARGHLEWLHSNQRGLIVDGCPEGSPYQDPDLRARLEDAFGTFVAVVLPSDRAVNDAQRNRLIQLKAWVQRFLIAAADSPFAR